MRYLIITTVLLGGCCWTAKRTCFPPCPPPVTKVVKVERSCELPPILKLPPVQRTTINCPLGYSCFDNWNTGKLAQRDASMKDWIREARARCGDTLTAENAVRNRPATRPTTRPLGPDTTSSGN